MDVSAITGEWDYSTLPANVRVGSGCFIERKESFLRYRSTRPVGLTLGDNAIVYTWAEFNVEPTGMIEVGADSVLVGPVFMCAERVTIGQRVVISYHVTLADSDFHPHDPKLRRQDAIANAPGGDLARRPAVTSAPIVIEDDVIVGVGAIVLKGVTIGKGAQVLAGAVVTRDVPPGCIAAGNPARTTAKR